MPAKIADIPVKTLSSLIARTQFAISIEESRFTLNGALLIIKPEGLIMVATDGDRKSTRLNSSHLVISYAVFCLTKPEGVPARGQRRTDRPAGALCRDPFPGRGRGLGADRPGAGLLRPESGLFFYGRGLHEDPPSSPPGPPAD